jgi:hypothetical protein
MELGSSPLHYLVHNYAPVYPIQSQLNSPVSCRHITHITTEILSLKTKGPFVLPSVPLKGKKVFPVHDTKGCGGIAPPILNLGAGWMWVVTIRPRPKLHIAEKAGWAPKPVLTFWGTEMSLVPSWIRAPDHRHKSQLRYLSLLLRNSRNLEILTICRRNR